MQNLFPSTPPALVLSGGSIRGIAHAGAARALQEAGIVPERIYGTSIGALVGAAIAGDMPLEELHFRCRAVTKEDIAAVDRRVTWPAGIRRPSLFRAEPFRAFLERVLPWRSFSELRLPLQINAVDLGTGEMVWFGAGSAREVPLIDAIMASTALPLFYPPVPIGKRMYIDGGARDTFPLTRAQEEGASWIIGIDVSGKQENSAEEAVALGLFGIFGQVFGMMTQRERERMLREWQGPPLLWVRPHVEKLPSFAFEHNEYLLLEGYRATMSALGEAGLYTPQAWEPRSGSGPEEDPEPAARSVA